MPQDWEGIAHACGLKAGTSWVKLLRHAPKVSPNMLSAPAVRSKIASAPLRVAPVSVESPAEVTEWAHVLVEGMGMPREIEQLFVAATGPDFFPAAAWDGDHIVASALSFFDGSVTALCGAATLAPHRGRGAQSALVQLRIQHAIRSGASWISAETYQEEVGTHNPSLHNLLRADFELLYERTNWVWRP